MNQNKKIKTCCLCSVLTRVIFENPTLHSGYFCLRFQLLRWWWHSNTALTSTLTLFYRLRMAVLSMRRLSLGRWMSFTFCLTQVGLVYPGTIKTVTEHVCAVYGVVSCSKNVASSMANNATASVYTVTELLYLHINNNTV